jgi:hypothetical protein
VSGDFGNGTEWVFTTALEMQIEFAAPVALEAEPSLATTA